MTRQKAISERLRQLRHNVGSSSTLYDALTRLADALDRNERIDARLTEYSKWISFSKIAPELREMALELRKERGDVEPS